jgi:hypothetical protein
MKRVVAWCIRRGKNQVLSLSELAAGGPETLDVKPITLVRAQLSR